MEGMCQKYNRLEKEMGSKLLICSTGISVEMETEDRFHRSPCYMLIV